MRALVFAVLVAGLSVCLAPPALADSIDGSDGTDGSDGSDGTGGDHDHDHDDEEEEEDEKGCSHLGRLATPVTGLSLVIGGALLVGARRQD